MTEGETITNFYLQTPECYYKTYMSFKNRTLQNVVDISTSSINDQNDVEFENIDEKEARGILF